MLVATDVAARGIDIKDVDLVVQFEPPHETDAYVHRSGESPPFPQNRLTGGTGGGSSSTTTNQLVQDKLKTLMKPARTKRRPITWRKAWERVGLGPASFQAA